MGMITERTEYIVIHTDSGDYVVPTDDGLLPEDDADVNTAEAAGL